MPETNIGTYHLADNPALYEVQRTNNFEFIVTDIDGILRAGAVGNEENARFNNAQEVLRCSVVSTSIPHFTQEEIAVQRGNTTLYYAGKPSFPDGQLVVNDFIGADTKSVLMAWQALSYDVATEKVGSLDVTNYKKDCYLVEYTPDYRKVRQWRLYGCWVKGLTEDQYNNESSGKKTITATIRYDRAQIDTSELA